MNGKIIHGLPNEDYHHKQPYTDYLSSSQLKLYAKSPKYARYMMDNPQPETEAKRFGSLFHDLMASLTEFDGDWDRGVDAWKNGLVLFEPPVNPKTNQPYGVTTKAYTERMQAFLHENEGKMIVGTEELQLVTDMAHSLLFDCGSTSEQVRKLLKWGNAEVSHFVEYKGGKFKFRPDNETRRKIVDWKTVVTDDLSEKSVNSIISKFGYDISAAFYQFMNHEQSGEWKEFYWCFISKQPPYDAILVDASEWTYKINRLTGEVIDQVGAVKMMNLLDLHLDCTGHNTWPGAEIYIPRDVYGKRILTANPPIWEINAAQKTYELSLNDAS